MVFYIIAAAEKDNSGPKDARQLKYKDEQEVARKITSLKAFTQAKDPSTLWPIKVSLAFVYVCAGGQDPIQDWESGSADAAERARSSH